MEERNRKLVHANLTNANKQRRYGLTIYDICRHAVIYEHDRRITKCIHSLYCGVCIFSCICYRPTGIYLPHSLEDAQAYMCAQLPK